MFAAFLDACVLVPVSLGDTLLRTAERGLFRPLWSPTVLDEVRRALLRVHPDLARSRIDYRLREMDRTFPDASVDTGSERARTFGLADPDAEHVLSAALGGGADVIVTANIRHFPEQVLAPLGVTALRPDDFLLDQLDLAEPTMLRVLAEQAAAMRHPPLELEDVLMSLSRAGAPCFADAVRQTLSVQRDRRPS